MEWTAALQILQTASIVIGIFVALGTLRGRGDDKTVVLTKMQVDIEYIKQRVGALDKVRDGLAEVEASTRSAHKRMDDHLRYDHNIREEKKP